MAFVITGTTISAGSGAVYNFSGPGLTVINQGYIDASPAAILSNFADVTVINSDRVGNGTVTHSGVLLRAGGSVTNQLGGTIKSGLPIQIAGAAGTVVNAGQITGTHGSLFGVKLTAGGSVANEATGRIQGGADGVYLLTGGLVSNAAGGTITGINGVIAVDGSAQVSNAGAITANMASGVGVLLHEGGTVTNEAGGTISGKRAIFGEGAALTIDNAGVLAAQTSVIESFREISLINRSTGTITQGSGRMVFRAGGSVINEAGGTIVVGGLITSGGGALTIDNAGVMSGHSGGIESQSEVSLINRSTGTIAAGYGSNQFAGGSVVNEAGGTISGIYALTGSGLNVDNAGLISGSWGVYTDGALTTNRSTGTIGGANGIASNAGTIVNDGRIAVLNTGVKLLGGSTLSNGLGGTIASIARDFAVDAQAASSIVNAGSIVGQGVYGTGVALRTGSSLTNLATGTITGLYYGVTGGAAPVTVTNAGFIAGTGAKSYGAYLGAGGSLTNLSTGTISGQRAVVGKLIPVTIDNVGTIAGAMDAGGGPSGVPAGSGVYLAAGGTLTNQAGGVVSGFQAVVAKTAAATVLNAGSIAGSAAGNGLRLEDGAQAVNQLGGTISGGVVVVAGTLTNLAGGVVTGDTGVIGLTDAVSAVNAGSIVGAGAAGIRLDHGGQVANQAGGTISGVVGVSVAGGAGTVSNAGAIVGSGGIAVQFAAGYAHRLLVGPGGTFTGQVDGGNTTGSGTISTLQLTSGSSTGSLTGLGTQFIHFDRIEVDAEATWSVSGPYTGTVANSGTIVGAGGKALTFGGGFANRLILQEGARFVGTVDGGNALGDATVSTLELASLTSTGTLAGLGTQFVGFGRIEVDAGATWELPRSIAGTVVNRGSILGGPKYALVMAAGVNNTVVVQDNAQFAGVVNGGNKIGAAAISTLELAGTGTLSGFATQFVGFAAVHVDAGANWTLSGANSIRSGIILTNDGSLTVNGSLTNAGQIENGVSVATGANLINKVTGAIAGTVAVSARYGTDVDVLNAGLIEGDSVGVLLSDNGKVTNTAGGTITGELAAVGAIGTGSTVDNRGEIIGGATGAGRGILWSEGGTVINRKGGTIGGATGLRVGGPTTVDNAGTIVGLEGTAIDFVAGSDHRLILHNGGVITGAVQGGNTIGAEAVSTLELAVGAGIGTLSGLGSEFVDFGAIVVDAGARWILGGGSVVEGVLTNNGRVLGDDSSGLGVKVAEGTIVNHAAGRVDGRVAILGAGPGAAVVENAGRLNGSGIGVYLTDGGSVTNLAGGAISGDRGVLALGHASSVVNTGRISGNKDGGAGVGLLLGGSVTNHAGGTISGKLAIYGGSAPLNVVNAGRLSGGSANGTGVRLQAGGSVTNQTGGLILGYNALVGSGGPITVANSGKIAGIGPASFGTYLASGGSVTNQSGGLIRGGIGLMVNGGDGTVSNSGTIFGSTGTAVALDAGYTNRVIVGTTARFLGLVDGGNPTGSTAVSTLELASGPSPAILRGLGTQFINFGQVTIASGASWTVQAVATALSDTAITGNGGASILNLTTAGTFSLGGVSQFPRINFAMGANAVTVTDATLSGGTVELYAGKTGNNTINAAGAMASAGKSLTYYAREGADSFVGGAEDDTIYAGTGLGTFIGGDGADRMVFISSNRPAQTFSDFQSGTDTLLLYGINVPRGFDLGSTDNAMDPLSPTAIDPTIFVANAGGIFTSNSQRLAYNTSDGSLYYGKAGSSAGAVLLTTLTGAPSLAATDILFER